MQKRTVKLISVLLTLVFLLSFATQAFAVSDMTPPMWQREGAASLEEFMDDNYMESEEEYQDYIDYYKSYYEWRDEYTAHNPNYVQDALNSDNLWFSDYYTKEEFMAEFGYTAEEFDEMVVSDYLRYLYYLEFEELEKAATRVAMGGTAEGLGVMFMGEYVKFDDAQPELKNNRTMIPVRAVLEFLGAEVEYIAETAGVSIILENGDTVYFEIGKTEVALKSGDDEKTLAMDVAPYISSNRTYVPLRFFSEILGYDVFWDSYYFTAVVVDKEQLVSALDAKLSIINEILFAQGLNPEKNYKETVDIKAEITQFDTIAGNTTAKASASMSAIVSGGNIDMVGKFDISELITLLERALGEDSGIDAALLKDADFEIIMNAAKGLMYLRSSLLALVETGFTSGTWIMADFDAESVLEIMTSVSSLTLGELMYSTMYGDIFMVESFSETADVLQKLFGDDKFVTSGSDKKLTLTLADMLKLADAEAAAEDYPEFINMLDFKITLSKNEGISGFLKLNIDDAVSAELGLPQIQFSMDFSGDNTVGSASIDLHIQNVMKIVVTASSKVTETTEAPRTAPPADAEIIDANPAEGAVPPQVPQTQTQPATV